MYACVYIYTHTYTYTHDISTYTYTCTRLLGPPAVAGGSPCWRQRKRSRRAPLECRILSRKGLQTQRCHGRHQHDAGHLPELHPSLHHQLPPNLPQSTPKCPTTCAHISPTRSQTSLPSSLSFLQHVSIVLYFTRRESMTHSPHHLYGLSAIPLRVDTAWRWTSGLWSRLVRYDTHTYIMVYIYIYIYVEIVHDHTAKCPCLFYIMTS